MEKPAILAASTTSATCGEPNTRAVSRPGGGLDDGEPGRPQRHRASAARRCRRPGRAGLRGRTAGRRRAPGRSAAAARSGQSRPQSRFRASRVEAASELPPPSPAPEGRRLSIEMSAPSGVPAACCRARAARRQRSSAGSGWPRSWRARPAVAPALEVQGVAPVDRQHQRVEQVVAVGPAAGDVQEQVQLGRRRHVVEGRQAHERRLTSRRAGSAPPTGGCGARRVAETAPAAKRVRSTLQPSCSKPVPGGLRRARGAGPGPAVQPVEPGLDRHALAEHLAGQGVEVGEAATALRRHQHDRAGLPAGLRPACCRAGWTGRACRSTGCRADRRRRRATGPRSSASARPARSAARRRRRRRRWARPARPWRSRRARGRRGTGREDASSAEAVAERGAAAAPDHRSTRSRASVSFSTSLAASRERPSRQILRASSVWPALHSTSPRCAAISGSGRAW